MAQKILGLDLGAHSVKAVAVEAAFRGHVVTAAVEVPLPPASTDPAAPAPLALAVKEALEKLGAGITDACAVSLPGIGAAAPVLTLPFLDARKIDATLGFEVEGVVPFDLAEMVYDHQLVAHHEGKSELLVAVARHGDVKALLDLLAAAGLDPRAVTLPGLAHGYALAAIPAQRPVAGEAIALVDLGHARTTVSVVVGGAVPERPQFEFTRTFGGGGVDLLRAMEKDLRLSREEAAAVLRERGSLAEDADPELRAALARGLGPAIRELRQTLRGAAAKNHRVVSRAVISGGIARLPGLPEHLARELGMPVTLLEPFGADSTARVPAQDHPAFVEALGLALRAQARGGKVVNLRKGDLAFRGDLDYLKGKVSRLVAFGAVILLLVGVNLWAHLFTLKRSEARLDEALCTITQKTLGKCQEDFNLALSLLQGGGTKASQIPTASAVEILAEATARMPDSVPVKLQELEVTLQKLRMRGLVDSFDGVDQVVAGLKKSSCFGDVKRGNVKRTKDDKIEFTLDVLYVCGQNADKAG